MMSFFRPLAIALLVLGLGLGGCSLFSSKKEAPPAEAAAAGGKPGQPGQPAQPGQPPGAKGPFAGGVLNTIAQRAPARSPTQMLAQLAAQFGWEEQVVNNPVLKQDVLDGKFTDRVEPFLLGLYYKNGFAVLPVVGEGHEFNQDTVVQGAIGSARLLDTSRKPIRIIFLQPVQNVQIIYYQDGVEPQVFSVSDRSVLAVRQSLVKYYLR